METAIITYNLRERGRQHTGQPRNFDVPRIAAAINGPACQERVRNREMFGFYGHWPRIKFGMLPQEGGIAGGKAQTIEPALITTLLKAHPDGTVEHQAEFLPTQPGQIAAKLYESRTGGFSSAIDEVKPELFGFDYVLAPNFTTNRGYSLDSVLCEGGACAVGMDCESLDAAIWEEQLAAMNALLDAAHGGQRLAEETLAHLGSENARLQRELEALRNRKTLDDTKPRGPLVVSAKPLQRLQADTEVFLALDDARLPFPPRKRNPATQRIEDPRTEGVLQRLGWRV
jgi:hypothetical protein